MSMCLAYVGDDMEWIARRVGKKSCHRKEQHRMPCSSTLGDHSTSAAQTARSSETRNVVVTVHANRDDADDERRGAFLSRVYTIGTCLLLVGSGIGVGIWAATV